MALELMSGGGPGMGLLSVSRAATLRYDYRNQMVEYADDDYSGEPHVYVYDCFGRRVMKMVYNPPANVPANIRIVSGGNTRSAAMSGGWQTLEEWDADGGLYASYVYGNYIDEALSMRKDIDGAGTTHEVADYYFHQDDLFNVVLVTDSAGDAAERYEYGDYGAPFYYTGGGSSTSYSAINNTRLFNGREWDDESRFYYYRTRYLEPTMGRFTTRDTIGVWGDAGNVGNGLCYLSSTPQSALDPLGQRPDTWHDARPRRRNPDNMVDHYFNGGGAPFDLGQHGLGDDFRNDPLVSLMVDGWETTATARINRALASMGCGEEKSIVLQPDRPRTYDFSMREASDPMYPLGQGTLAMITRCKLSVECCDTKRTESSKCTTTYSVNDSFSDPFDLNIEIPWIADPFQIEYTWHTTPHGSQPYWPGLAQ